MLDIDNHREGRWMKKKKDELIDLNGMSTRLGLTYA